MDFSKFLTMDRKDLMSAIGTLIFSAVIGTLYTVVSTPGFNLSNIDWHSVLSMIIVAVITSVTKNTATDDKGKLLGVAKVK